MTRYQRRHRLARAGPGAVGDGFLRLTSAGRYSRNGVSEDRDDGQGHGEPGQGAMPLLLALPGLRNDDHDRFHGTRQARRHRPGPLNRATRDGIIAHGATITGIKIRVKPDRTAPIALHDQVAAELRRAIAEGEATPGERLPPAWDLAAVLGVNANTVYRALRILRDEGLLDFRRGRGVTVAGTPERGAVVVRARELIHFARMQGFQREELLAMMEELG